MVPEINYIAVILATLSSMLVGTIWYSPRVFAKLLDESGRHHAKR
jgi:hypothetical protein